MKLRSTTRRYVGQNIKGTPAMKARKVRHDLNKVRHHSESAGVQEFKWPWYWRVAFSVMPVLVGKGWASYPSRANGLGHPIQGAQAQFWRKKIYRARRRWVKLLHNGVKPPGGSDQRFLRAVELIDRASHLAFIQGGTHFMVAADTAKPGTRNHGVMFDEDLPHFEELVDELVETGLPVLWEMDANIHPGTDAYAHLVKYVKSKGGEFHGVMGVEYLFTIPGLRVKIVVEKVWTIPTSELFTDHEGRGIDFHLETV